MSSCPTLVSVIVPLFNREKFLPQLYDTLVRQTYPHFEVILVDDGSTDNTEKWLQDNKLLSGQSVQYVKQQNQGPYVARNQGLDLAKGQYIAFQDSDDEWPEYHLADFVEALDNNPDIDWLFGSLRRIDHDTRKVVEANNFFTVDQSRHPFVNLNVDVRADINVIDDPKIGQVAIKHCVPGSTQCALIRRSVFEKNQFDASYRTAYDRFFAIKSVLRGHKFAFTDKTHQIYHIHDAHISLVAGAAPEKLQRSAETMLRGYSSLTPLARNEHEKSAVSHELARVSAWELSIAMRQLGHYKESTKAMLNAWRLQPLNWRYAKSSLVCLLRQWLRGQF